MQVIFLKNIPGAGKQNEVKNVSDGYAINFLFKQKLAVIANNQSLASLAKKLKAVNQIEIKKTSQGHKTLEFLKNKKISLTAKASDKGTLFKSISVNDLTQAVKDQLKIEVEPKLFNLTVPLKELGEHRVNLTFDNQSVVLLINIFKNND